jgi:hypothetical protein
VPSTVLIASPEYLAALTRRDDLAQALVFSDADALEALDAITRERPPVVAMHALFAATTRGTALINRIKADPSLTSSEIRIVGHDEVSAPRAAAHSAAAGGTTLLGGMAVAEAPVLATTPPPVGGLDYRGTRRAPRELVVDGVDVMVDGNPATLVDVSLIGAMVISPTILRPNQRVRMSLPDAIRAIRFSAGVAWAAFELLKTGPRYRAGIEFFDADPATIQRFIDTKKRP